MSSRPELTANLALISTLALFGVASFLPLESMWGINHLAFLDNWPGYLYWIAAVLACLIAVVRSPEAWLERAVSAVDRGLWGSGRIVPLMVAAAFMMLFFVFRIETCLVGDGCTWLDNYGRPHVYLHKWTEPGSAYLIRWLQAIQGEYTNESARFSFQTLSIVSGGVFVYNAISIAGFLLREKFTRILGLATLLLSGAMLLFFGYIEFYSMSWAAAALFLNVSLRYVDQPQRHWLVLLTYALAVLMHLQALYFLPGVVLLSIRKIPGRSYRKVGYVTFGIIAAAAMIAIVWLYRTRVDIEILILPLFDGRPYAPDYAVFSWPHLRNLVNLALLVFPGGLCLIALWLFGGKYEWRAPPVFYLSLLSAGSLIFACLFGAATTMGRDWDVLSLSLLAPILLILYQVDRGSVKVTGKTALIFCLTVSFLTCSYVAVTVDTIDAEKRAYSLLTDYNKNAWLIYGRYFWLKGDEQRYDEIVSEVCERYPDHAIFKDMDQYKEPGKEHLRVRAAEGIVRRNPYDPVFLWYLANAYAHHDRYDEAERLYLRAVRLKPYDANLKNELGQLYINGGKLNLAIRTLREAHRLDPEITGISEGIALAQINLGQYDSALAIADTLFMEDSHSAGGHLINMVISLHHGDTAKSAEHYIAFREYGRIRSDYRNILTYYEYLVR